jgi:hypothetical protein
VAWRIQDIKAAVTKIIDCGEASDFDAGIREAQFAEFAPGEVRELSFAPGYPTNPETGVSGFVG